MRRSLTCWIWSAILLLTLTGCGDGPSSEVLNLRKQLMLSSAPTNPTLITLAKSGLSTEKRVVITGWIGSGEASPWRAGRAEFVITEALPDGSGHRHKPGQGDDCPFCRRRFKPEEMLAVVQFTNTRGELHPIDARSLFGVKEGDLVVVEGTGSIDDSGILTVQADGIYRVVE
jgi:hypothetical protein